MTELETFINELQISKERLALALETSGIGIWEWDIITGKLFWSAELKKLYGLKAKDNITYEKYLSLIHPDDLEQSRKIISDAMKSGKPYKFEHRIVWPNGSAHWVLGQGRALIENGKPVRMIGTGMGIDDRKQAEIHMLASEERLARALRASSMGYWEWDLKTGELMWSPELRKLFGVAPDEKITHKKYLQLLHPDDRENVAKVIDESLKTGKPYTIEDRVVWKDGSVHWLQRHGQAILKDGKAVRMVGTSMNIDQRKNFEIELMESEERFRNMADAAPVLIWVAGPDKMLTYLNQVWLDFTGRKPGQDLGEGWEDVIHPDDLEYCRTVYFTAFDHREPYRMEYRIRRHDGKYLWMLDKGAPRYSPDGEFLGYVGSMIEVEEIKSTKKRQEELEEINHKLKQQRKQLVELNNSKDEFISVASHQLRTPATGVKQYIGMLLEGYGGKLRTEQTKMLQTAYESNERQLRIIDDLLKIAHVDAGKVTLMKTKSDMVDLLEDIIDEQADKFKQKRQGITFKHQSKEVVATIDPGRMRMVLENLIDNASKYSPEGKSITVELKEAAGQILIVVADQGVGIAKKDLPQLFQKFSRLDNALSTLVGGTGLGLYWVKKIVTLHNGTITVESIPNKGSTFTITLPGESHEKYASKIR